ncbi:MAG: glycosyltransferase [Chloroflexota bacterium]
MSTVDIVLIITSLTLASLAAYSAVIMLYAWEDEGKRGRNMVPSTFEPPHLSFTVLLPARHEEAVIQDTIQHVADLNYPRALVEGLVVIEAGDTGTIAKVHEKLDELERQGITNIRLITFDEPPINKPHGLNLGLRVSSGDMVTIFDAEDEPHPDVLNVVNTVAMREGAPVVQCGVQLMNYDDHWFSALNVLEYFFWFKSRLHYHASMGMVPLGGNTVFVRRVFLEEIDGWDQQCLTEDADLGVRLSAANVPIRVVYDDHYVTREETPHSVDQFVKQRTRWNQGFLQVLMKGDWLHLPGTSRRLLALYTLSFPLFQALMLLYIPFSVWSMISLKVHEVAALISTLPLYMLAAQFGINLIGLYEFTGVHGLRASRWSPLKLLIAYLPFQWMLGYAALRAAWRHLRGMNSWEKTTHLGAHRTSPIPASLDAMREEVRRG